MTLELLELYNQYLSAVSDQSSDGISSERVAPYLGNMIELTTVALCTLAITGLHSLDLPAHARSFSEPLVEKFDVQNVMVPVDRSLLINDRATESQEMAPRYSDPASLFNKPFYQVQPKKLARKPKTISLQAEGPQVGTIQKRLRDRGFNPGAIDSVFGHRTQMAVMDFQASQGLTANGIVDETTWMALIAVDEPEQQPKKLLEIGIKSGKVKKLQIMLADLGHNPGPIDGIFGVRTRTAVKKFQADLGLKADGIVDQETWNALNSVQ